MSSRQSFSTMFCTRSVHYFSYIPFVSSIHWLCIQTQLSYSFLAFIRPHKTFIRPHGFHPLLDFHRPHGFCLSTCIQWTSSVRLSSSIHIISPVHDSIAFTQPLAFIRPPSFHPSIWLYIHLSFIYPLEYRSSALFFTKISLLALSKPTEQ
jgi:hypothetical protein